MNNRWSRVAGGSFSKRNKELMRAVDNARKKVARLLGSSFLVRDMMVVLSTLHAV